ncbi:MAG: hypothetical protein C0602_11890 [Denitrovibrio sp.]|nr:MAG: hypothetical protein C0602_11890 [Denitrovibrio sp.]
MKKLMMLVVFTVLTFTGAFAEDIDAKVEKGMKKFFAENNIGLEVDIDVIKKLEEPKGLYFIRMTLSEKATGRSQEQLVFTDGKYLMPEILTIEGNTSIKDILTFEAAEKVDLDLSKLTLVKGSKDAKHVIVTVSDFQCPYCKRAHAFLQSEIKKRGLDVAEYMMHLPLGFHEKAKLYASILEVGLDMGINFSDELYATDEKTDKMSDEAIIDIFAKKTNDPKKFKELLKNPSILGKINAQAKMAGDLGITGTPQIYFDGKPVGGFKQSMYILALDSMK